MTELNYFRRQAIEWKYPELEHGKDKDFRVYNMDRNPESETYGQEKIDWNTDLHLLPTDEEMLVWYNQSKYLENRVYSERGEQLDRLTHDIENGLFGEPAKTGEFYRGNMSVKSKNPKPI